MREAGAYLLAGVTMISGWLTRRGRCLPGITELLIDWNQGDKGALDRLMPLVFDELRNVARRHMSLEDRGHTLESAALVNETYIRLIDQERVQWRNRAHFFAISARL